MGEGARGISGRGRSQSIFGSILAYARLDRFDEAKFVPRTTDAAAIHRALLRIAFMQPDPAAAAKEIAWFTGKPEEYQSLGEQSQNALIHGEFKKAAALAQQGAGLAEQRGFEGAAGQLLAQVAGMGEFRGSCDGVQQIGAVAALFVPRSTAASARTALTIRCSTPSACLSPARR